MRARLLPDWPDLSHLFGLKPWHIERLTPFELEAYEAALGAYRQEVQKG